MFLLQAWLKVGNSQRATAATGMNEKSSRSHSIFSIILTQTSSKAANIKTGDASRRSKINLVDLAGSERLSNTCASGDRLRVITFYFNFLQLFLLVIHCIIKQIIFRKEYQ